MNVNKFHNNCPYCTGLKHKKASACYNCKPKIIRDAFKAPTLEQLATWWKVK